MGEGGLLIVKNPEKFILAEMVREKGTNRKQFFKGFVDKYTWQVPGSSFCHQIYCLRFYLVN